MNKPHNNDGQYSHNTISHMVYIIHNNNTPLALNSLGE